MQDGFAFVGDEIAHWTTPLQARFGNLLDFPRRRPLAQMVKSLISARTRDDLSLAAYRRLGARWPRSRDLAHADPAAVQTVLGNVTFADEKAERLPAALPGEVIRIG